MLHPRREAPLPINTPDSFDETYAYEILSRAFQEGRMREIAVSMIASFFHLFVQWFKIKKLNNILGARDQSLSENVF